MRLRALALLCAVLVPAIGRTQSQEVQRALIQRDQQSDEFAQQLRQSQEQLRVPPSDLSGKRKLDAGQLKERRQLENRNDRQLQSVERRLPKALRPYERRKAAEERRELVLPPPVPNDPTGAPR